MQHFRIRTWAVLGLLGAGAGLLLLLPPERYSFYPRCPFFAATGLLCPGCGGTRALAALLRGNFAAAWHLNPLIVSLLPFAAAWAILRLFRPAATMPRGLWIAVALTVAAFTVTRNL